MAVDDEFGYHELMDRSCVVQEIWNDHILEHGALENEPELKKEAQEIADKMFKFYQNCSSKRCDKSE